MTPAPVRPTVDGPSARRRLPRSPWRVVVATWLVGAAGAAEPAQVLVVANRASAASVDLAEYYVRKRAIPLANLCLVPAPRTEAISRTEYQALEEAVRRCWHARRKTVAYVLLMPQVPLRISPSAAVPHPQTDQASVDSELALLPRVAPSRAGPLPNPYFQRQTDPFDPQRYGMLLVTRLAAQSLDHLRRLIDDSLRAGRDPALAATGRIVLDATDASDRPGNNWLQNTALRFPKDQLVYDTSSRVVTGQVRVLAYASWGSNDKQRRLRRTGFEWLPGSVATQYVSTDARTFSAPPPTWQLGSWSDPKTWFAGSPQSLTSDLIAEGATAATGHVAEPYLSAAPRPDILLPAYILDRRPLAEAFYLAIPYLSWMNIVVGDPLMRLPL